MMKGNRLEVVSEEITCSVPRKRLVWVDHHARKFPRDRAEEVGVWACVGVCLELTSVAGAVERLKLYGWSVEIHEAANAIKRDKGQFTICVARASSEKDAEENLHRKSFGEVQAVAYWSRSLLEADHAKRSLAYGRWCSVVANFVDELARLCVDRARGCVVVGITGNSHGGRIALAKNLKKYVPGLLFYALTRGFFGSALEDQGKIVEAVSQEAFRAKAANADAPEAVCHLEFKQAVLGACNRQGNRVVIFEGGMLMFFFFCRCSA